MTHKPGDIGAGEAFLLNGEPCCMVGHLANLDRDDAWRIVKRALGATSSVNPIRRIGIWNDRNTPEERVRVWNAMADELDPEGAVK